MDPNANLEQQRFIAARLVEAENPDPADVQRLAELVLALDEWIKRGGFLPKDWQWR
jgi:hypothetical protein